MKIFAINHINRKILNLLCSIPLFYLILIQSSCAPSRNSEDLIIAGAGKIKSLDPAQANTMRTLQLISALGDTLYKVDNNGLLIPQLADGLPEIRNEGLTIDIRLKKNVFFHDNTFFNAKSMKFSIERFAEIGTLNYLINDRIKNIETPSTHLLRINLTRPSSSLVGLLTSINLTPLSPDSYSNYKNKFLNKNFIGTGPYKLSSFQEQHQKITPFDKYWGKKPLNSGINFISLNNSSSLFGSIRTKEVDVLLSNSLEDIQILALSRLTKRKLLNEGVGSAIEIGYITLRSDIAPLNNILTRNALAYTFDRELISKKVSFQLREPLRSIIPPTLNKYSQPIWPKYNISKAKKLLAEIGYCKGEKLIIPITFRSNVPADKLLALTWKEQIRKDLSDCITVKPEGVESTTVYKQLSKGSFTTVILDWTGSYPDPEAYLSPLLSCNKIINEKCLDGEAVFSGSFWGNEDIQQALNDSEREIGPKRLETLNNLEKMALEGFAYIPIWIVRPRAWSQINITKPQFEANGLIRMDLLKRIKE